MAKSTNTEQIGSFIKTLREKRGLSQEEFAKQLGTSQSAVARMESGKQNFTTELLEKVSGVLEHKLVSINNTIDFEIHGGKKLSGSIRTNYSKNGSVGLLCAALLNKGKTILHGIARIEEVYRVIEILESIGVKITWTNNNTLEFVPPKKFSMRTLNRESAIKTRTIIMFAGPLAHHLEKFYIPHAQGCTLGKRSIAAHRYALESIGISIDVTQKEYFITRGTLKPAEIVMYEAGDTAIENILMGAALVPGKTVINLRVVTTWCRKYVSSLKSVASK
jgi:UDP-N-acetylglucosamine 1-carboxyvinyltransferase